MMKQRNSPPIEFNSRKIEKKSHKLELHFEKRKEKKLKSTRNISLIVHPKNYNHQQFDRKQQQYKPFLG